VGGASVFGRGYNRILLCDAVASQPEGDCTVAMAGTDFQNLRCHSKRLGNAERSETTSGLNVSATSELCEGRVLMSQEDMFGYILLCHQTRDKIRKEIRIYKTMSRK
jgi:hypothetical protein